MAFQNNVTFTLNNGNTTIYDGGDLNIKMLSVCDGIELAVGTPLTRTDGTFVYGSNVEGQLKFEIVPTYKVVTTARYIAPDI